jgi:hypothetical protein
MFRSTQLRFAVIALFAVAAISLTAVSARAFNQESSGAGGAAIRRLLIQTSGSTFSATARAHNNSNRVVRGSSASNGAN